jgi:uncharacterized protein (TIGR02452 family)
MSANRTSKFLSLVLRHDPAKIGITLDDAGWTDVRALLAACAAHDHPLTRDELEQIVTSSDKQRFALSPDGARIRANQGHSVDIDLDLPRHTPPIRLYHGTVGGRRGKPVILQIRAEEMESAGFLFFRSANGVWLTEHVPPAYIDFPVPRVVDPRRGSGSGSRAEKVIIAEQTLAACESGRYVNAAHEIVEIGAAIEHARRSTVSLDLGTLEQKLALPPTRTQVGRTEISVTAESTIEAIRRLAERGHVTCLNFASAKNPGGGFLGGAQAQEESLARSSALYPCLVTQPEHYARNKENQSALYLDTAIYSPDVPFFRDDDGDWLDRPVLCSVITCAAPNAGALRNNGRFDAGIVEATLRRRADLVLAIAKHTGADRLVLGAWGAGAFGNDPRQVAKIFHDLLAGPYENRFSEVVFAVLGGPGTPNHDAFAAVFAR